MVRVHSLFASLDAVAPNDFDGAELARLLFRQRPSPDLLLAQGGEPEVA